MNLQCAEVMHLCSTCEIQSHLLSRRTLFNKSNFGTHACIVATKGNCCNASSGVTVTSGLLMTDLPCIEAQLVDGEIAHAGRFTCAYFKNRNDE